MMCKFFGKQKPLERVNLASAMAETGLDQFFGSESWPQPAAVRELATKVGIKNGTLRSASSTLTRAGEKP